MIKISNFPVRWFNVLISILIYTCWDFFILFTISIIFKNICTFTLQKIYVQKYKKKSVVYKKKSGLKVLYPPLINGVKNAKQFYVMVLNPLHLFNSSLIAI